MKSPSFDPRRGADVVLSAFHWGRYGVCLAILFGSRAGLSPVVRGNWCVAVWPDPGKKYADLDADRAEALRAREEVDMVVISDDMPCPLALEVFRGEAGLPRRPGRVPGPHDEVRGRMHRFYDQPVEGIHLGDPRQEDMVILKELAQTLASYTAKVETYSPEDLRDPKKYFGALYLLQSQTLIDIALRAAGDFAYIDAGRKLKEKGVFTEEDYRIYADVVRFRNISAHK